MPSYVHICQRINLRISIRWFWVVHIIPSLKTRSVNSIILRSMSSTHQKSLPLIFVKRFWSIIWIIIKMIPPIYSMFLTIPNFSGPFQNSSSKRISSWKNLISGTNPGTRKWYFILFLLFIPLTGLISVICTGHECVQKLSQILQLMLNFRSKLANAIKLYWLLLNNEAHYMFKYSTFVLNNDFYHKLLVFST